MSLTQEKKWDRIVAGERVIATSEDMDYFESKVGYQLVSLPNPNQVGTRDRYIAWLNPKQNFRRETL